MDLFLGVDGGGTHSTFILIDGGGSIVARAKAGCAYYPEVGLDGVRKTLRDGFNEILDRADRGADHITSGFFAIPAYGEDSQLIDTLDSLPSELMARGKYFCGNDMESGWAGAFACGDGINIVAGTGSIAYGEFDGRTARAGGWGEIFSDEGSAYWVAREGLTLFSRMSDGRTAPGPLLGIVRRHFGLKNDLDLCAAIYADSAVGRSRIAGFAPIMSDAATVGDLQVQAIFERAAAELVALVSAVRASLGVSATKALPVSYSGGMFRPPSPLLAAFRRELTGGSLPFTLAEPRFPPSVGAALYAAKRSAFSLNDNSLERLTLQCRALAL
jgi:N-acetylglucosamine kinase-like BadF-type ATPase